MGKMAESCAVIDGDIIGIPFSSATPTRQRMSGNNNLHQIIGHIWPLIITTTKAGMPWAIWLTGRL